MAKYIVVFAHFHWTRARSALLVVCFLKEKSALKQHLELSLSYKASNFRLKLEVFSSSLLPWVRCHGNLCCRYEITTFWPISSPGNPSPFLEDLGVQTARESQVFVFIMTVSKKWKFLEANLLLAFLPVCYKQFSQLYCSESFKIVWQGG